MSGISPNGGVGSTQTQNTIADPLVKAGCTALWFKLSCNPKFDPIWANAVISEFLNFMKKFGHEFDCNSLSNLADAMDKFACSLEEAAPDLDDSLVGCIDGVQRRVTIQAISDLIVSNFSPFDACALNLVASPDLDDSLAGCFDGVTGRATIQSILDLASQAYLGGAVLQDPVANFPGTAFVMATTTTDKMFLIECNVAPGSTVGFGGDTLGVTVNGVVVAEDTAARGGEVYGMVRILSGRVLYGQAASGPIWVDCGAYNGTTVLVGSDDNLFAPYIRIRDVIPGV